MVFSSKKITSQIDSLLHDEADSQFIHKKTNALKSFTDWLRRKSYMNDKDYRNSLSAIHKTNERVNKHQQKSQQEERVVSKASLPTSDHISKRTVVVTACIVIGVMVMVSSLYYIYSNSKKISQANTAAYAEETGRVLHYRGKISSPSGKPVDIKTDVIFKLYYSAEEAAPIYIGACLGEDGIIPNHLGYFSILLGSDCDMKKIPDSLFARGNDIYLGVTIGNGNELKPRQLISKVSYAMNSDTLKGMALGSNTSNIPFIDKQGRLLIDATSPTLQSSSGTFTLDGQTITIKTAEGSGGSIYFSPDFGGNTIIATGNLGVGTLTPTAKLDIKGDASISGNLQFTAENSFINLLNNSSLTFTTSVAGTDSVTPRLSLQSNGNIGIGTSNPHYLLSTIQTQRRGSVVSFVNNAREDEKETNVLRLGLGTAQGANLASFIEFYAGATADNDGVKVGGIKMNNGNVAYETTGADFAEYFYTKKSIETGYIVSIKPDGISKSVQGEEAIGVVSDSPGFIGNASNNRSDTVIVGLLGQINTFVSLENGDIHVGDSIALSTIPGVGRKANVGEQIIGIALENTRTSSYTHTCEEKTQCKRIKVFINPSLQKTQLAMDQKGEITMEDKLNDIQRTVQNLSKKDTDYNIHIQNSIPHIRNHIIEGFKNSSLFFQNITSTTVTAVQGTFNRVESEEIVSPLVSADTINVNNIEVGTIAPKGDTVEINLQKEQKTDSSKSEFARMVIKGIEDKVVTSIDEIGNATFSGALQAESVVAQEASIAGTLVAKEVQAENINSIENSVNSLQDSLLSNTSLTDTLKQESQILSSRLQEIQNELRSMNVSSLPDPTYYQNLQNVPSTTSAAVSQSNSLENLSVANNTSLFTASITNSLTVGQLFQAENEIRSLTWNLNLSALSTVDFFNGQVSIAKDGTLTSKGKIIAEAGIVTETIDSKTGVVNVNAEARVNGITVNNHATNITPMSSSEHFNSHGINAPAVETTGEAAGSTYVPEQEQEVIIYNPRITDNSLIYLTNTSPTITAASNQLAVVQKVTCTSNESSQCKPYFKVISNQALEVPTHFNWLIIN